MTERMIKSVIISLWKFNTVITKRRGWRLRGHLKTSIVVKFDGLMTAMIKLQVINISFNFDLISGPHLFSFTISPASAKNSTIFLIHTHVQCVSIIYTLYTELFSHSYTSNHLHKWGFSVLTCSRGSGSNPQSSNLGPQVKHVWCTYHI